MQHIIEDVYNKSKAQQNFPKEQITNYVKEIYAPFTQEEISKKIARMLTSEDITSQVEIIYQTLEGLHQAIPNHPGDWYFSGNYPTPGGNRLVNNAFINFHNFFKKYRVYICYYSKPNYCVKKYYMSPIHIK